MKKNHLPWLTRELDPEYSSIDGGKEEDNIIDQLDHSFSCNYKT